MWNDILEFLKIFPSLSYLLASSTFPKKASVFSAFKAFPNHQVDGNFRGINIWNIPLMNLETTFSLIVHPNIHPMGFLKQCSSPTASSGPRGLVEQPWFFQLSFDSLLRCFPVSNTAEGLCACGVFATDFFFWGGTKDKAILVLFLTAMVMTY